MTKVKANNLPGAIWTREPIFVFQFEGGFNISMCAQGGGVVARADALRRKRHPGQRRRRRRTGRRQRRGRPGWQRRHGLTVSAASRSRSNFGFWGGDTYGGGQTHNIWAFFSFFRLCTETSVEKSWKILGGNQARIVVLSLCFGAFT